MKNKLYRILFIVVSMICGMMTMGTTDIAFSVLSLDAEMNNPNNDEQKVRKNIQSMPGNHACQCGTSGLML